MHVSKLVRARRRVVVSSSLFIKFTSCPPALVSLRGGVGDDMKGDESGGDEYE